MLSRVHRSLLLCLSAFFTAEATRIRRNPKPIYVPKSAPNDAGVPLESFVSFSFELSSWPDFAGNLSHPNTFSANLMTNLGKLQGSMPIARVGGNIQDIAIFDASQETGLVGIIQPNVSADYPTIITIGPAFFESYQTMPQGVRFSHGFNMGANSSAARAATWDSASYACKAIGPNLLLWEYGNEPDLFTASGYRPRGWSDADYVSEWLNGTNAIEEAVKAACPDLAETKFMAPSFAGIGINDYFTLSPVDSWRKGIDEKKNIEIISSHNYMGVSTSLGITLQGTLMNHTNIVAKAAEQVNVSRGIRASENAPSPSTPFILGEHNSLARQGRPGLSNSFGAALWGVDWNGTNYRYQSWQPIQTNLTVRGTKPPYYGNAAVAAFMHGSSSSGEVRISHLDSSTEFSTQYAVYVNNTLRRLLLVDLHTYNTTDNGFTTPFARPVGKYTFTLPTCAKGSARVQRLMANGSDAITGITWDGYSYNYELDEGKPVRLENVTRGEKVRVDGRGMLEVEVPWSSAAIVNVDC